MPDSEKFNNEKSESEKPDCKKFNSEKPDREKFNRDKHDNEKPDCKKHESKKTESKKTKSKKTESEKPESKKTKCEKPESEKHDCEEPESNKPESEKHESEKTESEKHDCNKPDCEKPDSEKPESEEPDNKKHGRKNSHDNRCRNMMYEQQIEHLPAKTIDHLTELLEKLAPKKYALIVHDKDVNEKGEHVKDHVHVMMSFENARSINSVAKSLGDKPQSMTIWKGEDGNGYSYLIHATTSSITKHQYPPEEVKANFNYQEEMRRITEEVKKRIRSADSEILLDCLYKGEITKEELEKKLSGGQYGRLKRQIEDVWRKRLQNQAAEWREEMKKSGKRITVIWISGKAGAGKTSLAREYAEKTGRPYFITGSSRDLFQNYSCEHTVIIDELRPVMMKYPDLLRILDPFGCQVMAPSRYSDKPLVCDLILITSPYDPEEFYRELFDSSSDDYADSIEQLLRRVTLAVKMDESHIRAVEYDREEKAYRAVENAERENCYSKQYREKDRPADNPKDLFEAMFREAPCEESGSA